MDVEYNMSREQASYGADSKNLSQSGICLITRSSLIPGQILDLKFTLPAGSGKIKVTGKVIWEDYISEKEYYINGIEFIEIERSDVELLSKFVDKATFIM